jgi:acetyl-CoA decarbonylase/synthase complex subunit alpha
MRANDTYKGRAIKLSNYIDLHRRYYGSLPEDVELLVRTVADVPITMKDEIMTILRQKNWKEKVIPDPTLLKRMVKKRGD